MNRLLSAVRGIALGVVDSYRLGFRTLRIAPILVAIPALAEFVQHIVEIRHGMFDSRDAAHAFAGSALRWNFGYLKIAGLLLALLLMARLWAKGGSLSAAWRMPLLLLARIILICATIVGVGFVSGTFLEPLWPAGRTALYVLSSVVQAGILVWLLGALVDDREASLGHAFTVRLPTLPVVLILFACAWMPGQLLHSLDHRLALGQPHVLIWALMAFDAVVVGMMAALGGAALWTGYRLGATWQGWSPTPQLPPAPHPQTR